MLKACIFDLDGTLAYTLDSMAVVANDILKSLGLKTLPTENYRYYCGEGASVLVRRCLKDAGDPELKFFAQADAAYREKFNQDPLFKIRAYEGMEEVVRKLKEKGILLGVCSNKPNIASQKVVSFLFGSLFDRVQGQEEGLRRKPAPDGALKIAKDFGVLPAECLYIGDTWTDMETGKAAGMFTVGALWGYRDQEELEKSGAMALAAIPGDILDIFERENI